MMNAGARTLKILAAACLMSLVGCVGAEMTTPSEDDTGRVMLSITNAPGDAACLRITVKGATTAVRSLPLMTNQSTTFLLEGLPSGGVEFTAEAFSVGCPSVTAESVASWVSDVVSAMLAPGQITNIAIALHRPGRANVAVDFPMSCATDSACPMGQLCVGGMCKQGNGGSCMTDGDCASGLCSGGVCTAPTCGGPMGCPAGEICLGGVCKKADGGSCMTDSQCASGLCSGGVCTVPTCGGPMGCPAGEICLGGLCKKADGGSCMTDSQCASGVCSGGLCKKANGAACMAGSECASGTCTGGVCAAPTCGGAGQMCCAGNTCSSGTQCNAMSICVACGGAGQSCCGGNTCAGGGVCAAGTCKTGDGGSCMSNSQCASGLCAAGVCKKAIGSACMASSECASGLCSGGVCAMPICGGLGQGCCGTGTGCVSGAQCNAMNICVACGGVGQSCCGGSTCASGGACVGGTCSSGPSPGPALQWKFDESSGTTALDASGNGFHGTYLGASGTPTPSSLVPAGGATGNPFSRAFVRSNQQAVKLANTPALLKPANGLTVSAWYRATSVDTSGAEIVSAGDNYLVRLRSGQIEFAKRITGATYATCPFVVSGAPVHLDGNWHHLAAVSSTAGMKLYFDGVERCTNAHGESLLYDRGLDFWVGRHGNGQTTWDFEGNLDDVRVYPRALAPSEITTLAAAAQ